MILQRLAECYDRLVGDPIAGASLPRLGYSGQKVSFCIVLESDGQLHGLQDLRVAAGKRLEPRLLLLPGETKPTGSGFNPGFLWDNTGYLMGHVAPNKKAERAVESFAEFRDRHLALYDEIDSEAFRAVCNFLRDWEPARNAQYSEQLDELASFFGVFRIVGEARFVHEDPTVTKYWERVNRKPAEKPGGVCLATGETAQIARLHEPKIKGVFGAQSSGALLVSFNKPAYQSYGKEQSFNAPVSEDVTFRYTNALNYLLQQRHRRVQIGDASVVFWAERSSPFEDFVSGLFDDQPSGDGETEVESAERVHQVRLFLKQLQSGQAFGEAVDELDQTRFYVLGLGPNASRLVVRFWIDSSIAEMKDRLSRHLKDLELIGAKEGDAPLSIRRIVQATGRAKGLGKGYDSESVSPVLSAELSRAVLTGGPYPLSLLTTMVTRIRRDGTISHVRVAAIKAVINRTSRKRSEREEVSVALDKERCEPGYLAGRLFAVLEMIQTDALGKDLNATIKDRYFSSASATPAVVFPRLIRLSGYHLAKLEGGHKVNREKLTGEIIAKLDRFPRFLNIEEQGLFTIGYFHQRQDLFKGKKDQEGVSETE